MNLTIRQSQIHTQSTIKITGSKSESNRLLLLQALYPTIKIQNLSDSDDSKVMFDALVSQEKIIDIHHAGTAMRFLTAFFAIQDGREVILTGSQRMKERPILILVEALKHLGADIEYLEVEGCPPLKIVGRELSKDRVLLKANVSSQYISALMLIAPKLKNGLTILLEEKVTSVPYIEMTLELLIQLGVKASFDGSTITIESAKAVDEKIVVVESDWSSASYFYSIVALSDLGTEIRLSSYKENSLQGDSILVKIYKDFGVKTSFSNDCILIQKYSEELPNTFIADLSNAPDIAQTIAVTCFGLGIACNISGLHTLKIKETDRLNALKIELEKLGGEILITDDSLFLKSSKQMKDNVSISTYNDHRMAMAFAPLALKTNICIEDAKVVSKSYPAFWDHLKSIGFQISQ